MTETTDIHNEKYRTFAPIGDRVTAYDVFRWPEFQALADRLGVPLGLRTTGLKIDFGDDISSPVRIYHEYNASDVKNNGVEEKIRRLEET